MLGTHDGRAPSRDPQHYTNRPTTTLMTRVRHTCAYTKLEAKATAA